MIRIILFIVGLISSTLLIILGFSMVLYTFGDSPNYGAIAYVPRWIFGLSVFVIFYGSKPVQRLFAKIEEVLF